MNLKDTLSKRAKETGKEVRQGGAKPPATPDVAKAQSKSDLASKLKSAKKKTVAKKKNDVPKEAPFEFETGEVGTWSFSALKLYENCPYATKLKSIDKIPQNKGEALERGSKIHHELELYVRSESDKLPTDRRLKLDVFRAELNEFRKNYRAEEPEYEVHLEEEWGIRKDWSPCIWSMEVPEDSDPELWGKASLDVFIRQGNSCRVIDYKTGMKFQNEMKHADQGLCYALHVAHRFPEIDVFQIEFWYVDHGEKMVRVLSRKNLMKLLTKYHYRAYMMTTATEFPPLANVHTCRFCPYGCNKSKKGKQYGNGHCHYDAYRGLEEM